MAQTTDDPVMEVRGLEFSWPDIALFRKLDLRLPPGVSVVCGEESSGKTTLLRLLSGDLQAAGGTLALSNNTPEATATQLHAKVFRTEPRSEALDALSATTWFESLPSRYPTFEVALAQELAQGFALEPHIDKPMYMLSAGSKRKVWLCAAFAAGTSLTLLDEPFAALDMTSIRFLQGLLEEASAHPTRAWLLADHAPPEGLALKTRLVLGH